MLHGNLCLGDFIPLFFKKAAETFKVSAAREYLCFICLALKKDELCFHQLIFN